MAVQQHRLSEKEKVFLVHAGVSADLPLAEIAKNAGMREHAARYVRDSLLERGLIHPVWFVDTCRLGFIDLGIFFTRGSESSGARRKVEQQISQFPPVTWLSAMGGGFQYGVVLNIRRVDEVEPLYDMLRPTEVGAYFKKTVRIGIEWRTFAPSFLLPELKERREIVHSSRRQPAEADEADLRVLRALTKAPGQSFAEVARALGMNPNSFGYRVDKLREKGIILGRGYWLATEKLGLHVFRVMITDRGLNTQQKESFLRFLRRHPGVGAIITCTGSWDYELRFEAQEPAELDAFCQQVYDDFGYGIDSITFAQQFKVLTRRAVPQT